MPVIPAREKRKEGSAISIEGQEAVSPKQFAKTLALTSQMLLEYHEEWGVHHTVEVTRLLWVLSDLIYAEDDEGKKMFFLDLRRFTEGD